MDIAGFFIDLRVSKVFFVKILHILLCRLIVFHKQPAAAGETEHFIGAKKDTAAPRDDIPEAALAAVVQETGIAGCDGREQPFLVHMGERAMVYVAFSRPILAVALIRRNFLQRAGNILHIIERRGHEMVRFLPAEPFNGGAVCVNMMQVALDGAHHKIVNLLKARIGTGKPAGVGRGICGKIPCDAENFRQGISLLRLDKSVTARVVCEFWAPLFRFPAFEGVAAPGLHRFPRVSVHIQLLHRRDPHRLAGLPPHTHGKQPGHILTEIIEKAVPHLAQQRAGIHALHLHGRIAGGNQTPLRAIVFCKDKRLSLPGSALEAGIVILRSVDVGAGRLARLCEPGTVRTEAQHLSARKLYGDDGPGRKNGPVGLIAGADGVEMAFIRLVPDVPAVSRFQRQKVLSLLQEGRHIKCAVMDPLVKIRPRTVQHGIIRQLSVDAQLILADTHA